MRARSESQASSLSLHVLCSGGDPRQVLEINDYTVVDNPDKVIGEPVMCKWDANKKLLVPEGDLFSLRHLLLNPRHSQTRMYVHCSHPTSKMLMLNPTVGLYHYSAIEFSRPCSQHSHAAVDACTAKAQPDH